MTATKIVCKHDGRQWVEIDGTWQSVCWDCYEKASS